MLPKQIQSDMTVFNIVETANDTPDVFQTVIRGVFWKMSRSNGGGNGGSIPLSDAVSVIVLMDGDFGGKTYLPHEQFAKIPGKATFWTLNADDKIINRAVFEPLGFDINGRREKPETKYGADNVFTIRSIVINDFGSSTMRHWKVTAN